MALNYNPEFFKAAGPNLAAMASAFKTSVHDRDALRAALSVIVGPFRALPEVPDTDVTVYQVPSTDGHKVSVVHIAPKNLDRLAAGPALLHAHGGGFVQGTAQDYTNALAMRVQATGVPTFTVDYRLAPESPFPAAVDDMYAALTWLHEHAAEVGVDRARIAVTGESAGGTLAAGLALMARDRGLSPPLAKQILIYPALDDRNTVPNPALEPVVTWNYANNLTALTAYVGEEKIGKDGDIVSPYAVPARAKSVEGLPPLYIDVGDLDIFRDECIKYAGRFAAANINVELHVYPGVPHLFEVLGMGTGVVERALANRAATTMSF